LKIHVFLSNVSAYKDIFEVVYHTYFPTPRLRYVQEGPLPKGANIGVQFIIATGAKLVPDPYSPKREDVSFGGDAGPMIYGSGFVGYDPRDPKHLIVDPDPVKQFDQAFKNAGGAISAAGGTVKDATDCQVWVVDLKDLPVVMKAYEKNFDSGAYPALNVNQVDGFVKKEAKVAVVCRAAANGVELKRIPAPPPAFEGLPASGGTVAADMAYTAGFYGPGSGDVGTDTKAAMDQVKAMLESAGSSMDKAIFCNLAVTDLSLMPAIDTVYKTYFTGTFPARQIAVVSSPAPVGSAQMSMMCIGSTA